VATSSFPSGHTSAAIALYGSLAIVLLLRARSARSGGGPAWALRAAAGLLLVVPVAVAWSRLYRGLQFSTPKVARDLHVEVARGLYSVPGELIGQRVEVRADSRLVKLFSRGQLIKTHPRVKPGGRSTDPADYPVERRDHALRDVASLTNKAGAVGPSVGIYAVRLLDVPLPWTSMRTVYRLLLGLARSYGAEAVDTACARALELDVVDVNKVTRMLEQARERDPLPPAAAKVVGGTSRFARDPQEFQTELALGVEGDPA